mgnify:CR=1 FL=1
MNSLAGRYIYYYGTSVLSAFFIILSFCGFSSLGVFAGLMLLGCLYYRLRNEKRLKLHPVDVAVIVLVLSEFVSGLFNTPSLYAKTYLFGLLFNVLLYFSIRAFLQKEKQERLFFVVLACFIILLALPGIGSFFFFRFTIEYEGFTGLVNFKSLFTPLGFLLNDWATIMLLSLAFVLVALSRSRFNTIWFWVFISGTGLVVMNIVCSFSRGAYLSLWLGILIFLALGLLLKVVPGKKMLLFCFGAILLQGLTALPVKQDFLSTAGMTGTTSQSRSVEGRMELWKIAGKIIGEAPLAGVGNGQFSLHAYQYLARHEDADTTTRSTNSYLQLLAEKGIFVFSVWAVFMVLLLLTLFRRIRKNPRDGLTELLVLSVFIAVLFRELSFSTFFEEQQMQSLFFVLAGWVVNLDRKRVIRFHLSNRVWMPGLILLFAFSSGILILFQLAGKRNDRFIEQYQQGDYPAALESISAAIRFDAESPLLLANKGLLLATMAQADSTKSGTSGNSLACYREAVKNSPFDPYLRFNLAWLYASAGKTDSADYEQDKACELAANTGLFRLGYQQSHQDSAPDWKNIQKAVRLSPGLLDSPFMKSLQTRYPGSFDSIPVHVIDSLEEKLRNNNSPILESRLARIVLQAGDTSRAAGLFEGVTRQLPNLDRPWYYLGMIKLARNDTLSFLRCLNRAAILDPHDYCYPLALGNYYYSKGQKTDAAYYYQNALVNYANIYTHHALIAPRWYGYKTLPGNILPKGWLEQISPAPDKTAVCIRLTGLLKELGQNEKAYLWEQYRTGQISVGELLRIERYK